MKRFFSFIMAFVILLSLAAPAAAASTYTYTDKVSKTKLYVPKDWDLEYEEYTTVLFESPSSTAPLMEYVALDYYDDYMTASERRKTDREDVNNDMFTRAEMAELLGFKSTEVRNVLLNGQSYFRVETEETYEQDDYVFSLDVTYWVHVENGWLFLYLYAGNHSASEYKEFKTMLGSADYNAPASSVKPTETTPPSNSTTYSKAVKAYESGRYSEAKELFESVSSYKDSSKYLRLIRIRNAGSNPGVGSKVYKKSCGLTASDKKDIDAAAEDFYFADTAEVLLCNSDVASYYLIGDWRGGAYCYITFIKNDYGCRYNIGGKLSTNYQSTFSIIDGEVRVDVTGANTLTMQLTLTGPDCMEVLTYEKGGKTYTLTRK